MPDDLLGEMVVSCIVPVDGVDARRERRSSPSSRREIASFKVPRRVLFFTDEDYAVTGNEKVKSSVVRELAGKALGIVPTAGA